MSGLIESAEYTAKKASLLASEPSKERFVEAAEWKLQHWGPQLADDPRVYQLVKETPRGPVRILRVEDVVIEFGLEAFRGEEKAVLLDVWIAAVEDDS